LQPMYNHAAPLLGWPHGRSDRLAQDRGSRRCSESTGGRLAHAATAWWSVAP
jgi:hypothetical protein